MTNLRWDKIERQDEFNQILIVRAAVLAYGTKLSERPEQSEGFTAFSQRVSPLFKAGLPEDNLYHRLTKCLIDKAKQKRGY